MTILDKVRETFRFVDPGTEFSTAEIKHMVCAKFGCNPNSVIPSDYCYNMNNKGKVGALKTFNLFEQIKHGHFRYVGENRIC